MFRDIFLISCFITSCFCENDSLYCIVNGSDFGIMLIDPVQGKDSHFADRRIHSRYRSVANEVVDFTSRVPEEWQLMNSFMTTSRLHVPVLDQRWEYFENNHDGTLREHKSFFRTSNIHVPMSVRVYKSIGNLTSHKWHHLMVNNESISVCEENNSLNNCNRKLDTNNSFEVYLNAAVSRALWKFHNYTYLYTTQQNISRNMYSYENNCSSSIGKGCLNMYVAACQNCKMTVELKSNSSAQNITHPYTGNGMWSPINITIENFSSCFNLSITTETDVSNEEMFWAIGDTADLAKNQSCHEIKRYISVENNQNNKNLTCETTLNENINFTDTLYEKLPDTRNSNMTEEEESNDETLNKSGSNLYWLFIIPALLLVIVLATGIHICKKKKRVEKTNEENTELINVEVPPPSKDWKPVKTNDFTAYVQELLNPSNKKDYLKEQFSGLTPGYLKAADDGKKPENVNKNRFQDICPYDENRVKLRRSDESSDYINASYIQGFSGPEEYIISQNPLEHTVTDFWDMVWQEKVEYIVMISGSDDFYPYWSDSKKSQNPVEIIDVVRYEFHIHRVLEICQKQESRRINHLHFFAWTNEMLSSHIFVEFINHLLRIPHSSAPVLIHCLAGIGRSGVIALCDIALRQSAITGNFNLFEITNQLRQCRLNMVTNLKQYKLAHLIIFESLNYKDVSTEIDSDFKANFSRLLEGNSVKKLWSVYLENTEWLHQVLTPYVLCSGFPGRNRYSDNNKLPAEHSRVVLQKRDPDYIHAMYVKDYQQRNLIVAQQPMRSTLSDFWIMILQNQVQIILNLNEIDWLQGELRFFPDSEKTVIKTSEVVVKFCSKEEYLNYDKILADIFLMGKRERQVCILNVKGWPKIKGVPQSKEVMVSIWEATRRQKLRNSQLLICCDDGVVSSGLVACFLYMVEKMIRQSKCDIVGAVKAIRRTHTGFINFEQFVFLHHCALAFYEDCFKKDSVL